MIFLWYIYIYDIDIIYIIKISYIYQIYHIYTKYIIYIYITFMVQCLPEVFQRFSFTIIEIAFSHLFFQYRQEFRWRIEFLSLWHLKNNKMNYYVTKKSRKNSFDWIKFLWNWIKFLWVSRIFSLSIRYLKNSTSWILYLYPIRLVERLSVNRKKICFMR